MRCTRDHNGTICDGLCYLPHQQPFFVLVPLDLTTPLSALAFYNYLDPALSTSTSTSTCSSMSLYSLDPEWEDVVPLPQDDGVQPLAQIAYTEEYAEAMSYLRAVMAKDEMSERVLKVTEDVIDMNPAHYTVW